MSASRVQVLERALDLMELLAVSDHGLSIAELSAESDLPKSTVHRILSAYTERHYIEKDPETSIYSLGYKFVEIASIYLNKISLKTEAAPFMHELANMFGATAYLGVRENHEVMYLERVEPFGGLRLYTQIGKREPLYCTALGKVLMAALPEAEFERIAKKLDYKPYTPSSAADYGEFKEQVELAGRRGYATDKEEHTVGSSCLAVPVYDYTGSVIAAMSISGKSLFERYEEPVILERMKEASVEISRRMGYSGRKEK